MDFSQHLNTMPCPHQHHYALITFSKLGMVMRQYQAKDFVAEFTKEPELAAMDKVCKSLDWLNPNQESFVGFVKHHLEANGFSVTIDPNLDAYIAAKNAYADAQNKALESFSAALIEELNIGDMPKAFCDRLVDMAHTTGHSSSLDGIFAISKDLVEMCQPLIDAYRAKS